MWVFQNLMLRSAVPPPEASRLAWKGHHASALTAAVCAVILCMGGPPADFMPCKLLFLASHSCSCMPEVRQVCGGLHV